jgi:hypothetical protein
MWQSVSVKIFRRSALAGVSKNNFTGPQTRSGRPWTPPLPTNVSGKVPDSFATRHEAILGFHGHPQPPWRTSGRNFQTRPDSFPPPPPVRRMIIISHLSKLYNRIHFHEHGGLYTALFQKYTHNFGNTWNRTHFIVLTLKYTTSLFKFTFYHLQFDTHRQFNLRGHAGRWKIANPRPRYTQTSKGVFIQKSFVEKWRSWLSKLLVTHPPSPSFHFSQYPHVLQHLIPTIHEYATSK